MTEYFFINILENLIQYLLTKYGGVSLATATVLTLAIL